MLIFNVQQGHACFYQLLSCVAPTRHFPPSSGLKPAGNIFLGQQMQVAKPHSSTQCREKVSIYLALPMGALQGG